MQSDCIYQRKELVPRSSFVATCTINMDEGQTAYIRKGAKNRGGMDSFLSSHS